MSIAGCNPYFTYEIIKTDFLLLWVEMSIIIILKKTQSLQVYG